ncbi:MAG: response regulator [Rhodocyclaceae bacterium]|nr:response regulator [Rhodocyclaceae bacterium]
MAQILVVDDEIGIRELLSEILRDEGHDVRLAENATAARAAREAARPDLVLLDIWMPDTDGITLLKEWGAHGLLTMPVVMMSGHGTIDTAVEATRIGAADFLEKPIGMQRLMAAIDRALERAPRPGAVLSLAAFPRSAPLKDLRKRLEQMAARSRTLLLRATSGNTAASIAELAARTLHTPGKAWIDLGRHAEPLSLEALADATGGLLWCEELAQLSRMQQKNLLFALDRLEKYDLRLVAATGHDAVFLAQNGWNGVDEGAVRRLFEIWLGLPALSDLRDEVPDIAAHLLVHLTEAGAAPPRRFSSAALNALRQHGWGGGYGELKGAVKSLALAALDEEIGAEEVGRLLFPDGEANAGLPGLPPEVMALPLREAREIFERIYFEHHLRLEGGNMTRLAEKVGLERTHLYRKLKDLGLRSVKNEE